MKELPKVPKKQFAKVDSLIRNICANYDNPTGLCLPLDTKCPQMITDRVICKYFRDVLLEDKEGADLKAQLLGGRLRYCESCRRPFSPTGKNNRFCPTCAKEAKRKGNLASKRKQRGIMV